MQIGEISKLTGLPISTLRYYDKHGLLQNLKRSIGGNRVFDKDDLNTLRMINCLKSSGMKISDIKQFMDWCSEGDSSINKRLEMFYQQERNINEQIVELKNALKLVKFKEWYYERAKELGSESLVKQIPFDDFPKEIQILYKETH